MSKKEWVRGDKLQLAYAAGISPQTLSNILNRNQRATPVQAQALEDAAIGLGYNIPAMDWIYSMETENDLFGGERVLSMVQRRVS